MRKERGKGREAYPLLSHRQKREASNSPRSGKKGKKGEREKGRGNMQSSS